MGYENIFKAILNSKRFRVAVASGIAGAAGRLGLNLPMGDVLLVVAPLWGWILTQGWADHGKNRPAK